MLITFKSHSAAEITMYQKHVQELFTMLDKDVERGVITAAETSGVIKKIENFIHDHQKNSEDVTSEMHEDFDDMDEVDKAKLRQEVSMSARLYPLLEMLQSANKKQEDVLWGV